MQGWGTPRGGWHRAGAQEGDEASEQDPAVLTTARTQLPARQTGWFGVVHVGVGAGRLRW